METKIEPKEASLSKAVIIAYIASLSGSALWLYGYFEAGHPPLIDWHTYTPWWIADFLPNMESEIGMALVFVSTVAIHGRSRRERATAPDNSGTVDRV
jgi:hypothetical protein